MNLQGAAALHRRFKAIGAVATGTGTSSIPRRWQVATVRAARPMVPVRTGATRRSIRPGAVKGQRVTVVGKYTVNFIDAGSKAHDEPRSRFTKTGRLRRGKAAGTGKILKFEAGGQTVFARKVHKRAIAPHRFKKEAARKGLAAVDMGGSIRAAWNGAA